MLCRRCGRENADSFAFCPGCGAKLGEAQSGKKRRLSRIAGILDIVSGGLALVLLVVFLYFVDPFGGPNGRWEWLFDGLYLGLVVTQLVGIGVSVAGGICALQRRSWGWAIAGAAAATLFGVSILGVASLVLTAVSKGEFTQALGTGQVKQPLQPSQASGAS